MTILDLLIFNKDFNLLTINETQNEEFDFSIEDIFKDQAFNFILPTDIKKAKDIIKNLLKKEEFMTELKINGRDGSFNWLKIKGMRVNNINDIKYIIASLNITKQKKLINDLNKRKQKFKLLYEDAPLPYHSLDDKGYIKEVNKAWLNTLGYEKKDVLNVWFGLFISPEDRNRFRKNFQEFKKTGKACGKEYKLICKDGSNIIASFNGIITKDKKGNFIRTHCIFNNITERKQLEIKLRKSEEKYRSLVETSPNSIILLDLTGDLIDSNKVAEKYFQLKRDNIIGENLTELGHEFQEIHSFLNKGLKILKTSSSECFEFNLINTSGEPIYLNNHISKVKIGDEEYIQIVSEDITERKRAEKIVKNELKRLKEIKNIKNAFLIRASHELKTPLNSISSSVNLFQNLYGDKLDERGLRLINIIENGGTRLNKLIQDLLDVISIEKQKFKLEREKLDIVKMLNNCLKNLKNLFKKRNLEKEFYENREMEVYIDRIRIEQVFTNILMNSIKNTPPKGLITILIKKHSHFLDVIFKDNGIGFTKEEKKKIFKRFGKIERNGNGLNVMDEGAGLGLFLAKKIVEQHGGNIWVKSKGRNEGTMVTVRLPL